MDGWKRAPSMILAELAASTGRTTACLLLVSGGRHACCIMHVSEPRAGWCQVNTGMVVHPFKRLIIQVRYGIFMTAAARGERPVAPSKERRRIKMLPQCFRLLRHQANESGRSGQSESLSQAWRCMVMNEVNIGTRLAPGSLRHNHRGRALLRATGTRVSPLLIVMSLSWPGPPTQSGIFCPLPPVMQVQRRTACKRVKGRGTAPGRCRADAATATAARTCAVKPRLMLLCSSTMLCADVVECWSSIIFLEWESMMAVS
ncbi:hypothetical protein V8C34DRAFT_11189 [Trichoderma compactum]